MNRFICVYQNVRGINSKLSNLYLKSFSCDYSVIAFTESWLKPATFDLEVFCDKWCFSSSAFFNSIFTDFFLARAKCGYRVCSLVYCGYSNFYNLLYIPPNYNSDVYSEHARIIGDVMKMMSTRDIILVCDDFNIPDVAWRFCLESGFMVPANFVQNNTFFDALSELGLMQLNKYFNTSNRLLDLVYSNVSDLAVRRTEPFVTPEDGYHPTLRIDVDMGDDCSSKGSSGPILKSYDFKRANFYILQNPLLSVR